MFGYITANPRELTEQQANRYRAWYCGMCRELRERYGRAGQISLSNDMTFLAMLLSSLYEPAETTGNGGCSLHPMRRKDWTRTGMSRYAADMNYLLAYWKCDDNRRDDHDLIQSRMAARMERSLPALEAAYPRQAAAVRESLEETHRLEAEDSRDIDALCACTGRMLGEIMVPVEDAFAPILRELGSWLGRFIYLMDAWEDLAEDARKGSFNPLKALAQQPDYEELIHESLLLFMGKAAEACSLLPLEKDEDLIRHVLYKGVWTRYAALMEKRGEHAEGNRGDSR